MATKDGLKTILMPMAGGVDERTQPELVDPSRNFLQLENVRADRRGSYRKRPGFAPMSLDRTSGSGRATLKRIIPNDGNLCTIDNSGTLDAYVEQADAWRNVGIVPECKVTRTPTASGYVSGEQRAHKSVDAVEVNGYRVVAFTGPTSVGAAVYDAETGAMAYPATLFEFLYLSEHDVVVAAALDGTCAHVIYANAAASTVYRRTIDTADLASGWSAAVTLTTALDTSTKSFDACSFASSWALVFMNVSGTGALAIRRYDDAGTVIVSTEYASTSPLKIAVGGSDTDTIWIANMITTAVRVFGVDPTTLAVTATSAAVMTTGDAPMYFAVTWTAAGEGIAAMTDDGGATQVRRFHESGGAVVALGTSGSPYLQNTSLASRPWLTSTGRYQLLVTPRYYDLEPNTQQTLVVIDVTDAFENVYALPRVVATIAPRLELHNTERESEVRRQPHHVITSGSTVVFPAVVQRTPITAAIEMVTLDYDADDIYDVAEYQGITTLGSGLTSIFDGAVCSEANWCLRPQIAGVASTGSGSITLTGTGWTYVAIFEYVDARGNVHRSAPSDPVSTNAVTSKASINITVHPLYLTNRQTSLDDYLTPVNVVLYRTANAGVTYYRCVRSQNRTTGVNLVINDTTTDAELTVREQLYTQPGLPGTSQSHACPPGLRHLVYHQDRIIGVGDDGYTLWPTAPYVYGEGMWWADVFQVPIPDGGAITALASSDGRLYAFKKDRIFVIDGDGPSDNGTGGQFSAPQRLPTELGCLSHRSVVVTPVGIFFQSPRGIELLSGQQVQWVGELVQNTFADYPNVTSAVCRQTESRVLFTCVNDARDAGATLVFDYGNGGAWTVDNVYDSGLAIYSAPAEHALAIDGDYYRGTATTGRVWSERTALCLDDTTWITSTIETAWHKPAGLHGAAEIPACIFAGVKVSPCFVQVEWAHDYRDEYETAQPWDEPELLQTQSDMGRIHLESRANENARGMSAKLRLSDAPPTNTSYYPIATAQGITWFGYSVEAAISPGRTHLPVSARAG